MQSSGQNNKIKTLIDFLKTIEKFKLIKRRVYLSNSTNEDDAQHSWHLAMFLIIFQKELDQNLDMQKMLKMALIHDLPEIISGDFWFFDDEKRKNKKALEAAAMQKLLKDLPSEIKTEFLEIWEEYEGRETKESKIVHSFDKIAPILQNICSDGKAWNEHDLIYEQVDEKKKPYMEDDKTIKAIYDNLMAHSKKLFIR